MEATSINAYHNPGIWQKHVALLKVLDILIPIMLLAGNTSR